MNELIYLHELDSVRTCKEEVLVGQRALYREILHEGNCVVITCNQLSDSPAFLCPLWYESTYQQMLQLFDNGSIKLSRFYKKDELGNPEEVRTSAQYMIYAITKALGEAKNDAAKFIFSGLPIREKNKPLLRTLRDAIQYSDAERIRELIAVAQDENQPERQKQQGIEGMTAEELEYIYRYVKLILRLSRTPLSSVPARKGWEEHFWGFLDFLAVVRKKESAAAAGEHALLAPYFQRALEILDAVEKEIPDGKHGARSSWLDILKDMPKDDPAIYMAETILNLCYNYTLEESIPGAKKTYGAGEEAFRSDFFQRLEVFWQECCFVKGKAALHRRDEVCLHVEQTELPNWALAVSVRDETKKQTAEAAKPAAARRQWQQRCRRGLRKKVLRAMLYIFPFILVEWSLELLQTLLQEGEVSLLISWSDVGPILFAAVFSTIAVGELSGLMEKKHPLPDISDILETVWGGTRDLFALRKEQKGDRER